MQQLRIFIILILLSSTSLYAENTVILKNGTNVKGKVIDQDDKNLTIKSTDGSFQKIQKGQILKVIYKDLSEQEAQKIRLEEEKKLKAKEDAERLKREKEESIANKKKEEEIKKEEELNRKKQAADERIAAEEAKKNLRMSDADWETYREKNKKSADAAIACGSRLGLVWRSILIPGWGQTCGKNYLSAGLFFGSIVLGAYYTQTALKTDLQREQDRYDQLSLLNQTIGPPTKFTSQYISTSAEFTTVLFENFIVNEIISKSKNESKTSNAMYHGGLGLVTLVYLTNVFHAYWIGRDVYPERSVVIFGREIKPGLDWNTSMEMPGINKIYQDQPKSSLYAEIRYSILF
jgi:hypothetical protein